MLKSWPSWLHHIPNSISKVNVILDSDSDSFMCCQLPTCFKVQVIGVICVVCRFFCLLGKGLGTIQKP